MCPSQGGPNYAAIFASQYNKLINVGIVYSIYIPCTVMYNVRCTMCTSQGEPNYMHLYLLHNIANICRHTTYIIYVELALLCV